MEGNQIEIEMQSEPSWGQELMAQVENGASIVHHRQHEPGFCEGFCSAGLVTSSTSPLGFVYTLAGHLQSIPSRLPSLSSLELSSSPGRLSSFHTQGN